ncbi:MULTISPECIES: hypothetical protein [Halobacterium]|uniref:hypothetical protein n=1 Tax=Halobacterium TaxID=2239 RepID=UPI0012FBD28A|nr:MULTISPECIES: hypothetical protein [Halobacterium]MCG1004500.1 hypothetical protein [Halobacterium noricense]
MSRSLILCEGKWDMHLLRQVFERLDSHLDVREFNLEEYDGPRRGEETRKIDWLKRPDYPGDVLIKAEGGRTFLKRTIASSINDLVDGDLHLRILADLDHRSVDEWLGDVNERFDYTKDVRIDTTSQIYDCNILCCHSCSIFIGGNSVDEFNLIAFKQKMEEAVGIDKGIHDKNDKCRLINQFSEDSGDFNVAVERTIL